MFVSVFLNYYSMNIFSKTSFLQNIDIPNAGRKLVTLPKRLEWNPKFQKLVIELDAIKPVVVCGDFNVAHNEIGLHF